MTAIDETHHLDSPDLKHSLWRSLIYQEGIVWMLENILKIVVCMLLSGLLMADYTKTTKDFNDFYDFYDREIDVINEPYRPILSGAISVPQVVTQILVLLGVRLALKYALDIWTGYVVPNDVFFDPRRRTCGLYLLSPSLEIETK